MHAPITHSLIGSKLTAYSLSLFPRRLVALAVLLLAPLAIIAADAVPPKLKQFIYVLKLVPRLHDDKAWTDADKAVTSRHFAHLTAATKNGQVILAGRTMEPGDKTFGLVIFESADEAAARAFMNSDPAVVEKIMTAELHPYAVALQRKPPSESSDKR